MKRLRFLLELLESKQISLENATTEVFYEIYAVYDVEKYVGVDSVLVPLKMPLSVLPESCCPVTNGVAFLRFGCVTSIQPLSSGSTGITWY